MKKHIPNLITSCNVLSGTLAILMAMQGDMLLAAVLVLVGMIFDFLDGMTARLLHVKSELGKELDSLADVVSFGVVPAILAHLLLKKVLFSTGDVTPDSSFGWDEYALMYCPILMAAFSAYRLAKFNLDTRQTYSFIGMPTPANALFWVCLAFTSYWHEDFFYAFWGHVQVLVAAVLILSVLLVAEIPMFSLKITCWKWQDNKVRYLYFGLLFLSLSTFQAKALSFVIPLYILFSIGDYLRVRLMR